MMIAFARLIGGVLLVAALTWPQAVTGTVSGTVTSSGQPAPNVTVRAFGSSTTPAASVTTAADGAYALTLPRGVYRVEFSGPAVDPSVRYSVVVLEDVPNHMDVVLAKAGTTPKPESLDDLQPGEIGVMFETRLGSIFIAADTVHAPVTSANFLKYVDAGLYASGRFHRATRPDNYTPVLPNRPAMELIQAGINPDRAKEGFPPIPLERTSVTGLKHVVGTVSMARGTGADTATSDFFILLDNQPSLDFGGKRFDDGQGGAAFGRVYFGLGVVRKIQQEPVQGQNLTPPVLITRATRQNR
jgi:peptidyl-prolyl cis-trans isomerase A (cyclophilin A)